LPVPASFVTGQTVTASTTSGTGTLTTSAFAGSTTTGNLIVVGVSFDSGTLNTVTAVSDSKSNTYTKILDLDGTQDVTLWYAQNITGGASHTVTVTFNSGAGAALGFVAQEFTGIASSSSLDKSVIAQGTSTTPASGNTAATTQADELVVGVLGFSSTSTSITLGSGYSNLGSVTGTNLSAALESKVVAATGAQSAGATLGASRAWCMGVATFKAASTAAVTATTTSSNTVTAARTDSGAVSASTTSGSTVTANTSSPGAVSATTTAGTTVTAGVGVVGAVSATTTVGSTVTASLTAGVSATTTVGSTVTALATIGGFTFVAVTGTYENPDGTAPTGKVTFTPTAAMRSTSAILEAGTVTGRLSSGVVSVSLAATDDASTTPTDVTYVVVETITGAPTRSYNITVPHLSGSVDLGTASIT
jgi:hypothetical protein